MAKHNIVILHTDAQMSHWLGVAGNTEIHTPHLDQLAKEGIHFTNAHACSAVCVPSRAALMTGRYPVATGVVNNSCKLPPTEKTLGQYFAKANYDTGYFGKTEFAIPEDSLEEHGWKKYFLRSDYNQYLTKNGIDVRYPEKKVSHSHMRYWNFGKSAIPEEHYFEKVLTDRALKFISEERDNPFLCMLSWIAPHGPFTPPGKFASLYNPEKLTLAPRSDDELENKPEAFVRWVLQNQKYVNEPELHHFLATVYAMVSLIDEQVGRVMAHLRQQDLLDNTLIIFTSDHGDYGTSHGIFGKSWNMTDPLLRVPFIVRSPNEKANKSTFDGFVENADILPTLLEYAGIHIPAMVQGKSFYPLLNNENFTAKSACFAFNSYRSSRYKSAQATIRRGRWRLIVAEDGPDQLFDVPNDFWNLHNVAAEHPDVVADLKDHLLRWQIGSAGLSYDHDNAAYWEDETLFWDETRFTGERIAPRSK